MKALFYFVLIFLIGLCINLPHAAISVQESDGGEFATAAVLNALAHPPGYPIYMQTVNFLVGLFPTNPYQVLATFSGVMQSLATALLFLIAKHFTRSNLPSVMLALTWLLFEPSMRTASDAEVFALHHVFVCLLVLIALNLKQSLARAALVGLVAGVGGAHHQTIVLWAPLVLAVLIKETDWKGVLTSFVSALSSFFAVNLFLFTHDTAIVYPLLNNFTELFLHVFRFDYGTFSMHADTSAGVSYLPKFLEFALTTLPLALLAIVIFPYFIWKKYSAVSLGLFLTIALHFFFASQLKMPYDDTLVKEFAMRFYGLLGLAVVIAMAGLLGHKFFEGYRSIIATLTMLPVLIALPKSLPGANAAADHTVDFELEGILQEVPKGQVFVSSLDRIGMGLYYKQHIEKKRPDLIHVVGPLINHPGYKKLLADRFLIDPNKPLYFSTLLPILHKANKRVYAYLETPIPDAYQRVPIGVTWEILPNTVEVPKETYVKNVLAFCKRLPLGLKSIPPERKHSNFIVSYIFEQPFVMLRDWLGESELKEKISQIVDLIENTYIQEAQAVCREPLILNDIK